MYEFDFDYEIKRFSNKSSSEANPQVRSDSIIVSFNALFQGTDYYYVNIEKIKNKNCFKSAVDKYLVAKKIPKEEVVVFPLYNNDDGDLIPLKEFQSNQRLCGFVFYLKRDLRCKYNLTKITSRVQEVVFQDLLLEVADYNNFLNDDIWLIVVSKPHGRNFIVYGKEQIDDKLFEINKKLSKEV